MPAIFLATPQANTRDWLDQAFDIGTVIGNTTIAANQNLSGIHFYNNLTINAGVVVTADAHLRIFCANAFINNGTLQSSKMTETSDRFVTHNDTVDGYGYRNHMKKTGFQFQSPDDFAHTQATKQGGGCFYGAGDDNNVSVTGGWGLLDNASIPEWWGFMELINGYSSEFGPLTGSYSAGLLLSSSTFGQGTSVTTNIEIICKGLATNSATGIINADGESSTTAGKSSLAGGAVGIASFSQLTNAGTISANGGTASGAGVNHGGGGAVWLLGKTYGTLNTPTATKGGGKATDGLVRASTQYLINALY